MERRTTLSGQGNSRHCEINRQIVRRERKGRLRRRRRRRRRRCCRRCRRCRRHHHHRRRRRRQRCRSIRTLRDWSSSIFPPIWLSQHCHFHGQIFLVPLPPSLRLTLYGFYVKFTTTNQYFTSATIKSCMVKYTKEFFDHQTKENTGLVEFKF